jgi:hypothetical protein
MSWAAQTFILKSFAQPDKKMLNLFSFTFGRENIDFLWKYHFKNLRTKLKNKNNFYLFLSNIQKAGTLLQKEAAKNFEVLEQK